MKKLLTALTLLLTISTARADYCLKNQVVGPFYVYNSDNKLIGEVKTSKHFKGIKKDDFPLTISSCSKSPDSCAMSADNHKIKKPHCYTIYYYGGFSSPRVSCYICDHL